MKLKKFLLSSAIVSSLAVSSLAIFAHFNDYVRRDNINLKETLERRVSSMHIDHSKAEKYAVIINGDTELYTTKTAKEAYESLKKLEFKDDNIFVAALSRYYSIKVRSEDPWSVNCYGYRKNIDTIFDYLSKTVDNNDLLVVFCSGHGNKIEKDSDKHSVICLCDSDLSSKDYRSLIEKVDSGLTIAININCFSGGLAKELEKSKSRIIAITPTDENNTVSPKYFIREFWKAQLENYADSDHNGDVTIHEAFVSALKKHKEESRKIEETNGQYLYSSDIKDVSLRYFPKMNK